MTDTTDSPTASSSPSGHLRHRLADEIVTHRRLVLAVVFLIVVGVSAGLLFLEEESGLPEFTVGSDEEQKLESIESNFSTASNQDIAQIIVRDENVFEKETLLQTIDLQAAIRTNDLIAETLDDEQPTTGIANVIARAAYQLENPDEPAPSLAEKRATLESLSQAQIDTIIEELLAPDGHDEAFVFVPTDYEHGSTHAGSTLVVVFQEVDEQYPPSAAPDHIVGSHLAVADLARAKHDDVAVIGSGILTDEEERALDDTMALVGPAALILVLLVLVLAYRDLVDVLLGLIGIILVQLWTFGTLGWLGMAFNPVLVAVPVLLIGLSIDFCIHVFMRYRENRHSHAGSPAASIQPAMKAGLAGVGAALVWVTVTTTIGFLSNLVSPVDPIQQLGLIAAIGIVGSFVVFVLLLPPLKVELDILLEGTWVPRNTRPLGASDNRVGRMLVVGSRAAQQAPVIIVVIVVALTLVATGAALQVSTSWGPEENMVDGAPGWTSQLPGDLQPGEYSAKEELSYANEHYVRHGSEVELLIEGSVTESDTLERIRAAENQANQQPAVVTLGNGEPRTVSPLTTIERVAAENDDFAATVAAADTSGNGIPDSDLQTVYDHLFEVAPAAADEVLHRVDGEYVAVRMSISVDPEADGGDVRAQFGTVTDELEDGNLGLTVTATGEPVVGHIIQQHLLNTLLWSLAITLLVVLAVLMVVFRTIHGSATLGAITILPVCFAVSWIIGTMYFLGYPLTVLNAIIASLTIGIGIDYSIHVSERFRDELAGARTVGDAISTTVRGTGGALLGSAATTAIGFGVLALAVHPPLQQFGTITAIMIGYSFIGAVIVLPSLLLLWARWLR